MSIYSHNQVMCLGSICELYPNTECRDATCDPKFILFIYLFFVYKTIKCNHRKFTTSILNLHYQY